MLTIRFRSCQCGPAWPGEEESERPSTTTRHFAERRGCSERTVPRSVDTGRRGRRRHQPCPDLQDLRRQARPIPRRAAALRTEIGRLTESAGTGSPRQAISDTSHREGPRVQLPDDQHAFGAIAGCGVRRDRQNLASADLAWLVEAAQAAHRHQVGAKQITGALLPASAGRTAGEIAAAAAALTIGRHRSPDRARDQRHRHGDDHLVRHRRPRRRSRHPEFSVHRSSGGAVRG